MLKRMSAMGHISMNCPKNEETMNPRLVAVIQVRKMTKSLNSI